MIEQRMSFLNHLEVLRWHLIRSIIAIVLCGLIVAYLSDFIFDDVLFAQTRHDFITYRFFNEISQQLGMPKAFVFQNGDIELLNTKMFGQFQIFLWVCLVGGSILAFPYVVWEISRFIGPGLTATEKKYAWVGLLASGVLFFTGILMGYFLISPFAVQFGYNFVNSNRVKNLIEQSDLIYTITLTTLGMGTVFLFPLLVYFLVSIELISASFFKTYRRHAWVLILFLAGIITPADVFSMILAAIPIFILYEFSILLAHSLERRKKAKTF